VVLALAPDEAVEPHHYDHRANHAVATRAGKKESELINRQVLEK
jgi:hypothetical protein